MSNKEVKRRAYLAHLTVAINKLTQQLTEDPRDELKIVSLVQQVTLKFQKVEDITDGMQEEMDAKALEADIQKMDDLENQVIDVKVKAEAVTDDLQKKKLTVPTNPVYPSHPQNPVQIAAKLPDCTLREFHGDEESFPSFIDNFTALVHNNPYLPDVEKFSYLRGVVKVDVINHYPLTGEHYKLALEKLKRVYGDKTLIATKHLNALLDMNKRKKPENNKELEEFYHFLETKITCLEALNRPVSQDNEMLITLIYRQLPKKLKEKVAKLPEVRSTVKAVLDIINEYLRTSKQMDYREGSSDDSDSDPDYEYSYQSRVKKKKSFLPDQKPKPTTNTGNQEQDSDENFSPITSSAGAFPVVSQRFKPCVYCQGNHPPIHCHIVVDINQRKDILRRSNRCYNCLSAGHRQSDCRVPGRCHTCQWKHHTSVCTQRPQSTYQQSTYQQQQQRPQSTYQQPTYQQQHQRPQSTYQQQQQRPQSNYQQEQQRGAVGGQNMGTGKPKGYQGLTTATSWEAKGSVLLQIAEAELRKPHGLKFISGNIFFDLGSQYSYCTKEAKEELNLDIKRKDVLELNTFGRTESEAVPSDVVTLQVVKGGFSKEITVHTTDVICSELPSFKISKRKLQEIGSVKLAHPRCKFEGSHKISLLIGADLYWEFVGVESITTSYGLRASNSKLGWLLSGITDDESNTRTQINLSVIHHVSTQQLQQMKLDTVAQDKEWMNKQLQESHHSNYLDKLDTVHDYKDTVYQQRNVKAVKKVSTLHSSVIKNTYHYQNTDIHDGVECVEDWNQYKVRNTAASHEVDLSWFWETEHIGILPEEQEPSLLQIFEEKIQFDEQIGRYKVELPCDTKLMEVLPDNYHICEVRLQSLLEKLNKPCNKGLLESYNEIFKSQEQQGIIEEVNSNINTPTVVHYLPHHCVIKKDKSSSAVRVVYDGSAKLHKKAISLNKCLHAGPSLVNNLASVLLRFRMFKVGVVADIRKAFLQISLAEDDRDVTRFLWRKDGNLNNPITLYRFNRVPFGLTSSPFLLHATILHHLRQYQERYPVTVPKLLESFYVDDMVTGADTEEETVQLVNEGDTIMKEANMELTKWNTSSPNVINKSNVPDTELSNESTIKVLGIKWNKDSDELAYATENVIDLAETLKPSKRTVLRVVSKVYDPLGPIAPFLVTAKILLQRLCKMKLAWDDSLPAEIIREWRSWMDGLHLLKLFSHPRCINQNPRSDMELVGFCDASKSAYAAVIYIRSSTNHEVNTNFIMARCRVAPMKPLTIPRLELLGAVLLVRLMSAVLEFLSQWTFHRVTYYSDSSNVLYWIAGEKIWNNYITKRLDEIHSLSRKEQWYHCPGEDNPADLPTRGITMEHLSASSKWFHGPSWLAEITYTPNRKIKLLPSQECLLEERKLTHAHITIEVPRIDKVIQISDHSSFRKLCRITAYALLFIKFYMKQKTTHLEMQHEAERRLILNEQRKYYSDQISYLKDKTTRSTSSVVRQLDLFLDKEGLLRCAGRYKYSNLSFRQRYPILLPKESQLTVLIIEDRHRRVKHAGVKTTLTEVREDFWIPRGRRMVKNIINKCIICRKLAAKPFKAPGPPPLPPMRLSDMPPFTNAGVDFAGPIYCRERGSKEAYKSYIALFTCASTRAVSLELVPNMTAHSFKNAMIRFVSNRGIPHVMISDNAKTFLKTAGDLNCFISRSPNKEFLEDNRITWLFYLERSPWWGGFIERMVGSVKTVLRKALYRTFMSYDEMSTLLKQIESVINSRPITYLYDDDIEEPLTPSHLLIGRRSTQLPPAGPNSYDTEGRSMYREKMLSHFEQRWRKEYMSELQDYHISMKTTGQVDRTPKIGEVVIMKEDKPRHSWKLARITNIYTSRDEKIRSIEVIKPNKKLARRPPQLLIPLEYVK
jgi:hypothetical protein